MQFNRSEIMFRGKLYKIFYWTPKPVLLPLIMAICAVAAVAQTSAFMYQGKLTDAGAPANGSYLLQFALYTTETVGTGSQIGTTITDVPVTAVNGIFTVKLDFGSSP